uniref:MARVEL domain-containing protein n=2 Tax=Bursaphelenchus xylophilus TaxID=6326 RepID=A0A1I7RJE6_BURXY
MGGSATVNAPPIRFDRHYFLSIGSHLKVCQILLNLISLFVIFACYPNSFNESCLWRLYSSNQLFIIVCVNGFFFVLTTLLWLANAFSFPDAYYQFNFHILERLHALFAMAMYVLAIGILVCTNTRHHFSSVWLVDLAALFITLLVYALDYWRRRKDDGIPRHQQSSGRRILA